MSAAQDLLAEARAAGADFVVLGPDRLHVKFSRPLQPSLIDRLRTRKLELIDLLLAPGRRELPADADAAQVDAFEERAGIVQHDGGLTRSEAERTAAAQIEHERATVRWLVANPPPAALPTVCQHCRQPETREAALLPFLASDGGHRWIHRACWDGWYGKRLLAAERAVAAQAFGGPAA